MDFQTCGSIATDLHMFFFTQYKTTCLSAMSSHWPIPKRVWVRAETASTKCNLL